MSQQTVLLLVFAAVVVFMICLSLYGFRYERQHKQEIRENEKRRKEAGKSIVDQLSATNLAEIAENRLVDDKLDKIFNDSKNPWKITKGTFQLIRFGGFTFFAVVAIISSFFYIEAAVFCIGLAVLCVWYPMYYYTAIGNERKAEWNKMYEFVWVIKHNCMLYDPAKAFLNTRNYIAEHAPHNKEIIQGFQDFYDHWNDYEIDDYINKYYSFAVPKEIYQIVFNMHKSGEFPDAQLNNLRQFIVNAQSLTVEKALSSVSGQATIYSLPFLMVSVIAALMVPMIMQIIGFL